MCFVNLIISLRFCTKQSDFILEQKQIQLRMRMRDQEWDSEKKYDVAHEIKFMLLRQNDYNAACVAQEIQKGDYQLTK